MPSGLTSHWSVGAHNEVVETALRDEDYRVPLRPTLTYGRCDSRCERERFSRGRIYGPGRGT